jgi:hypothetical protein
MHNIDILLDHEANATGKHEAKMAQIRRQDAAHDPTSQPKHAANNKKSPSFNSHIFTIWRLGFDSS